MMLDSGPDLDLNRVAQNIDEADVITIYFPLLGKTLILDSRRNEHTGPLITIVPIATDSVDRYQSFRKIRPAFPRPESISMIPWPRRIDSLTRLGIWSHVMNRVKELTPDYRSFVQAADSCLHELRELEMTELLRAVSGEQYHTLWAASSSRSD